MNIKSLLLGSAAALVAATGARAADAIVIAEPEPMEYVRICDMYGVGYFYIPGTETCLKIGGWVRYEIYTDSESDGWSKTTRGRLEINARNESEWGTVASYIRLDSRIVNGIGRGRPDNLWVDVNGNGVQDVGEEALGSVNGNRDNRWDAQYSLGIGGLEMGYRDAQWARFSGYGGLTDWGGNYGYQERHYISYTFTGGNGFSGIISLDHDDSGNYMPDIMAGVAGSFGDVRVTLSGAYDESTEEFAVKGTVNAPIGPLTARVVGMYASGSTSYYAWSSAATNWSVIAALGASVTEATSVAVDFQYIEGGYWQVIGNVNHQIAPGLSALLEVSYDDNEVTTGMLRFQRSF